MKEKEKNEKKESLAVKSKELQGIMEWGEFAMKAGLLPYGTNIYQASAIVQAGKELGLQALQSIRSMSFIKGRLAMTVQLQLALAKAKGVKVKSIIETDGRCEATLKREDEEITCTYTLEDAQKAGLVREGGAYEKYERQMLRWRAVGDVLRLIAPDLVMGLLSPEEAQTLEPLKISDTGLDKLMDEAGKEIEGEVKEVSPYADLGQEPEVPTASDKEMEEEYRKKLYASIHATAEEVIPMPAGESLTKAEIKKARNEIYKQMLMEAIGKDSCAKMEVGELEKLHLHFLDLQAKYKKEGGK